MKRMMSLMIALAIVIGITVSVQATLIDQGEGLIYDTDLDITWLQDANYTNTSGYDDILYGINTDGTMYWSDAVDWANSLVYQGHENWRLPTTPVVCYGPSPCNTSEMGYLYWTYEVTAVSPGPFNNVRPGAYWSETTFYGIPWYFPFSDGSQGIDSQNPRFYAWAVADGKVSPVPEPSTLLLLGSGLIGVVAWKRKNT